MTEQAQHSTATAAPATGPRREQPRASLWVGWIWFAATMMIITGLFNVIFGLVALFRKDYYVVGPNGLLLFNLTSWGWLHLVVGACAVLTGLALFSGATWARVVAVLLAGINALAQLAFLPASPAWSVIAIALDVLVIWAVVVHGRETAD
ncbi:hypothetical protein FPZ12_011040 [Amycolatopsis acidicola]|uniref:DUF7144 domain-containing protein n=1 Tax=Amycolatopsis acidicola TaxID=2596893 RepID=A0A5N0VC25_9PSEU|nr:hypothetical protein [Amycolatopsis acidicola]KAA9162690.1 hypothetical protein FPZ12_011040 [Amycolatopsis acidicola]